MTFMNRYCKNTSFINLGYSFLEINVKTLQIIMDYVSCDMKYIIDIEIMINNDLLVTSWQNIERNKWNIMHELVLQIVTQQLGYKKHCAKSTGWWLFTLAADDLLTVCGKSF